MRYHIRLRDSEMGPRSFIKESYSLQRKTDAVQQTFAGAVIRTSTKCGVAGGLQMQEGWLQRLHGGKWYLG